MNYYSTSVKHWFLTFMLVTSFATCQTFDVSVLTNSTRTLQDALSGVLKPREISSLYVPSYGMDIRIVGDTLLKSTNETIEVVKSLILGLGLTVKGLPKDEYISISILLNSEQQIIVRVIPAKLNSLEVWEDGKKSSAIP